MQQQNRQVKNRCVERKTFSKNRLTSEIERGIIGINKDMHAIFIVSVNRLFTRRNMLMKRKNRMLLLFAVALMFLLPGISAEAKTKPKLEARKQTTAVGQKCQLKLNGVPGRAKVKWKTSNKRVVSITKRKGNTVTFKTVKKGMAVVTATYKKKKYQCRVTVQAGKKKKPVADHPVLNSSDVTLYYLSEEYKDYLTYDSSHLREYRFRVSGRKKEVRDWEITGDGANYFEITDYGLLRMDWEPAYVEPCVKATITAMLEDGRKLTAAVRAYSETNIYIDKLFADFERRYITPSMTTKEKAEKAAWYISTTSDYELYNYNWLDIFLKGKGDCYANRYALQYLCNYMGIKAVACRNLDDHGKTLVYADGRFYVIVTGFNEPKPRPYGIYEISGGALEDLAEKNKFDLDYFRR